MRPRLLNDRLRSPTRRGAPAPPFPLIDVGDGRRLIACLEGPRDAPSVIFDHGAFGMYADGWWLKEALKADHRVLLYGRAGMGWSDPAPPGALLTADWHVGDMRQLASHLGLEPPFILIGHSMAGLRLHAFANLHIDEVAGLVFVDAMRPATLMSDAAMLSLRRVSVALRLGEGAARIGVVGLAAPLLKDDFALPAEREQEKRHVFDRPGHWAHSRREIDAVDPNAAYFQHELAVERPLLVFACAPDGGPNAALEAAARDLSGFAETHAAPDETHTSLLNPGNAERIAAAVRRMEQRALKS
jgi:pimeloyl-ACP methyl ester carboxylesterase